MNKTKYFMLFLIVLLGQKNVWSQHQKLQNETEWIQSINQKTKEIRSLTADFVQEKTLSFLENAVVSTGKFWFSEPDQIRWEYQKPYSYTMIMDGGVLTVKDQGEEYSTDLSSNKMFEQMNTLIAGSIQGKLLEDEANYTKEYYQSDQHIIVRFIPKDQQLLAYLDYIEISFGKISLEVDELMMHEPSGDFTKMKFTNRKINQAISSDVFH